MPVRETQRRSRQVRKDKAQREADRLLSECLKSIDRHFAALSERLQKKAADLLSDFQTFDDALLKKIEDGSLTVSEYKTQRTARWNKIQRNITDTLADMVVAEQKKVDAEIERMAINTAVEATNYTSFALQGITKNSTVFDLVDGKTIQTLEIDGVKLVPDVKSKPWASSRWNRNLVSGFIREGMLKGWSIPKICGQMQRVAHFNRSSARRTARTACTMSENTGRRMRMQEALDEGIHVQKQWLATLDDRTRDTHAMLDGEIKDVDEPFSNGCMEPGDPDAEPSEVWNCRCTLTYILDGQDFSTLEGRAEKLNGKTYEEWKNR